MRGTIIQSKVAFVVETCCACGVVFALNEDHYDELQRRKDTASFYCPNGHSQHYVGKSDKEKIRDAEAATAQLAARLTHEQDQHEATKRSNAALKGVITKARRRVGKGVCPCCKRSFPQLREHMATEHPEYAEAKP